MKKIITFCFSIALLSVSNTIFSGVLICFGNVVENSVLIEKVSYDQGDIWESVQLNQISVPQHINLVADPLGNANERTEAEEIRLGMLVEGIEYNMYDEETKTSILMKFEMIGNSLYLNDEKLATFDEGINTIQLKLPGLDRSVRFSVAENKNKPINELAALMAQNMKKLKPFKVNIFPNPVVNDSKIYLNSNRRIDDLKVFDLNGKLVLHDESLDGIQSEILINDLKRGLYIFEITDSRTKKVISKKVIVE